MTILDDIIAYKRDEVAGARANAPLAAIEAIARDVGPVRDFEGALRKAAETGFALIAEVKKASPSKGLIRADFDPVKIAAAYERGGAACLSVLTDGPSFQGSREALQAARGATRLPVLRKDFLVDPYQVAEARAWGADCILVIMACTEDALAADLVAAARSYGMAALIETHDEAEMERALRLDSQLIGVNNRDLNTFETRLETTERLSPMVGREQLLIAESGVSSHADVQRLAACGVQAFLVGESLMRQDDLEAATRNLIQPVRSA